MPSQVTQVERLKTTNRPSPGARSAVPEGHYTPGMAVDERRIAVLGSGKIGEALISGLLSSEWRPGDIVATGRRPERLSELHDRYGIRTTLSNPDAAARAALVVIAVKPQDIDTLLAEIAEVIEPDQTVLSVAAAIPTGRIERALGGRHSRGSGHAEYAVRRTRRHGRTVRGNARRTTLTCVLRRTCSRISARSFGSPSRTWMR